MLSFGIRFGQGFDRLSLLKVMQSVPSDFDYDLLVIGSNPGGVACAREASLAGRKTAIIRWQKYTPAEEEGFNENLEEMASALEISEENALTHQVKSSKSIDSNASNPKSHRVSTAEKSTLNLSRSVSSIKFRKARQKNRLASRKVRRSRLDLTNELFKRGQQCRKLMHNASGFGEIVEDAKKCGWRVFATTPSLSMNWNKMTEDIMDYVMEENWKLMSTLNEENVEIINGCATFVNNHTVRVRNLDLTESEITADMICLAPSADYVFPKDVAGAEDFGISCDDFHRMSEPPKKTLIVGGTPEALECAGILANCRFPVTVVSRWEILKNYDSEISQMIIRDLKKKGVVFLEETTLKSIEVIEDGDQILAKFMRNTAEVDITGEKEKKEKKEEEEAALEERFDTVLFAVGKSLSLNSLNLKNAGIAFEPDSQQIRADKLDSTEVANIYAVGEIVADRPKGFEISQLAGKLLGKRLFSNGSEIMDYTMLPSLVLTPTEYAFVGLSEDAALYRLGLECVSVYYGSFKPLDFVIPQKNHECFAKVVVFKPKGTVVGLHFYGPEAGETIQGFEAALRTGLTMTQLQTLAAVPTTKAQEILKLKEVKANPAEEIRVE